MNLRIIWKFLYFSGSWRQNYHKTFKIEYQQRQRIQKRRLSPNGIEPRPRNSKFSSQRPNSQRLWNGNSNRGLFYIDFRFYDLFLCLFCFLLSCQKSEKKKPETELGFGRFWRWRLSCQWDVPLNFDLYFIKRDQFFGSQMCCCEKSLENVLLWPNLFSSNKL